MHVNSWFDIQVSYKLNIVKHKIHLNFSMGNSKNSRGSHASRGKYAKKKVPRGKKDMTDKNECDGSRIINLNKLNEYLQEISHHTATCQSCSNNALSGSQAIVLVGEKDHQGLCSILTSRCAGCSQEFQFAPARIIKQRNHIFGNTLLATFI